MWALLYKVQKRLPWAIPAMLVAGFLYGAYFDADPLRALVIPFTFLMVYPMMVTLRVSHLVGWSDLPAQLLTQGLNFAVIPLIAYGLGLYFFPDEPYMALGLLLAGLLPTSGMTISWTGFAKGNLAAAIKMTVIGLILGALATPFYIDALLGATLEIDFWAVTQQIGIIVILPLVLGVLTQRLMIRIFGEEDFKQRWSFRFPALSTLGVLGIVFIAMALNAATILEAPSKLLLVIAPVALLYAINFPLSTIVAKLFLNRGDGIALVYGSVMRNLSIALAVAMNAFGPEGANAALVIALAYIIQVQAAAWYVRFSSTIFGEAEDETRKARGMETTEEGARLQMDVYEDPQALYVVAEVPGLSERDLQLRYDICSGVLHLAGEKHAQATDLPVPPSSGEDSKQTLEAHLTERSEGAFERRIPLHAPIQEKQIQARLHHGVLTVTLPKAAQPGESERIEQIPIRGEEDTTNHPSVSGASGHQAS
ncbi:MAG: bile acid:sodium symporter [Halorhodospira sp.]